MADWAGRVAACSVLAVSTRAASCAAPATHNTRTTHRHCPTQAVGGALRIKADPDQVLYQRFEEAGTDLAQVGVRLFVHCVDLGGPLTLYTSVAVTGRAWPLPPPHAKQPVEAHSPSHSVVKYRVAQ